MSKWVVDVKGDVNGESWEISVVKGAPGISWGWFGEDKLLVSHNGGPCHWPLAPGLGPLMVEIAHRYADHLNSGGRIEELRVKLIEHAGSE